MSCTHERAISATDADNVLSERIQVTLHMLKNLMRSVLARQISGAGSEETVLCQHHEAVHTVVIFAAWATTVECRHRNPIP